MNIPKTADVRVSRFEPLTSPIQLLKEYPAQAAIQQHVHDSREQIAAILDGRDDRVLAIVGPCSIHDTAAAYEYADRLKKVATEISSKVMVVMRVYFEKPRTRLGWKGLILDPALDGSNNVQEGLRKARRVLLGIAERGLPAAIEALDPIVPQYIDDLVSWAAIGARTTESQTHREMASGLSFPVGFKNGTDGSIDIAVNAMASSFEAHSFIGIDEHGRTSIVHTTGNKQGHIILRGGKNGPNYYREKIEETASMLRSLKLPECIIVDCSHANAGKDHKRQGMVLEEVLRYRSAGLKAIRGFMLESNLHEGRQDIPSDLALLKYGVSVTDPCIGWEDTEQLLKAIR